MTGRYAPLARYCASLLGGFTIIAGSVVVLLEAPTSASAARPETTTAAILKRAVEPKSLPLLRASDFDIARSIPVNVKGKSEPSTIAAPTAAAPSAAATPADPSALVTTDAVNLRADANKNSPRLGVVPQGAKVAVLEAERGWSRVQTEDGQTGWLASRFLRQ